MPLRPANISGQEDILQAVNQIVREMTIRLDNLNKVLPIHRVIKATGTLNFGTIAANSTVERSLALIGAAQVASVSASPQLSLGNVGLQWSAYSPSSGTVTVRLLNSTTSPIAVNTVKWNISAVQ